MSTNPFGHIDLRVPSMAEAMGFYSKLLPSLGFTRQFPGPEWAVFAVDGTLPSAAWVALTEEAGHRPNSNRVAFWAASRAEVDRIAEVVKTAGGLNISGPKACLDYSSTYYALFFDDPCGNRFEICFRTD